MKVCSERAENRPIFPLLPNTQKFQCIILPPYKRGIEKSEKREEREKKGERKERRKGRGKREERGEERNKGMKEERERVGEGASTWTESLRTERGARDASPRAQDQYIGLSRRWFWFFEDGGRKKERTNVYVYGG